MTWRVDVGDCVHLMAAMPACSVDAVVCDPPYGLEFMGKEWDRLDSRAYLRTRTDGRTNPAEGKSIVTVPEAYVAGPRMQEWHHRWATEALRVLKPGGHLLAFGGTRTSHRLACAIEDAGFEIRDTICWLYGSGFPKSLDVGKAIDKQAGAERERIRGVRSGVVGPTYAQDAWSQEYKDSVLSSEPVTPDAQQWDGWGTALKPAHEPIVVARKPLAGTVAGNVLEHGTGGLNVDGCRIGTEGGGGNGLGSHFDRLGDTDPLVKHGENQGGTLGRWPANVVLDEQAAAMLDQQSGEAAAKSERHAVKGGSPIHGGGMDVTAVGRWPADSGGGASRFFYTAKASRAERNAGLDGFEEKTDVGVRYTTMAGDGRAEPAVKPVSRANHHPTVKPVSLMRWLVRLVTPPDGLILDPFTGSGTTGIAAVLEGFNFAGCEQDAAYADIARARIGWWELHGHDALRIVAEQEAAENERAETRASGQMELL